MTRSTWSPRLVQFEPRAIPPLQFGSPGGCSSSTSAPVSRDSLCLPVSLYSLGGSSLPCDLTSLRDLRRVIDFKVCSVSYLFLG